MPLSYPTLSRTVPWARRLPAALAAILITLAPVYAHGGEITHVVSKGQTLGQIARRYHSTVDAIREANHLQRWQQLHPGLALVIPLKGKEAEAAKKAGKPEPAGRGKKGVAKASKPDNDAPPKGGYAHPSRRPGFVRLVRGSEKLEIQLRNRQGRLVPSALAGLSRMLRFYPTDAKISIDPRLASLIAMVSDHFAGRPLHVVSGYRPYSPAQYTPHSNHNVGRAMDFAVEGVPNTVVRDFCRSFRSAGVGYYPYSTFVHLDARAVKTFWIDYSHPGEAPRYDATNGSNSADEAAKDVEPHEGVVGGATPGSDSESGSN